jgi:hypothetical protein
MEPEGSSPHAQEPATSPYPDPDQAVYALQSYFSMIHFNIILPSKSRSSKSSLSFIFPNQNPLRIPVKEKDNQSVETQIICFFYWLWLQISDWIDASSD